MSDYVQKKKSIADNLAAIAQPVSDSDLASSLLSGLSSEYEAFITSMTTRFEPISLDELTGFLLSQEACLEENSVAIDMPAANVASHSAGLAFRGRGRPLAGATRGRNKGHGRGRNTYDSRQQYGQYGCSSTGRTICQVCNKPGHIAVYCYHRYEPEFQGDNPSPAALMAGSPIGPDNAWYPDSSATHHLTADMANLSTHSEYHGPDQVQVGNGNSLPISHVGPSVLHSSSQSFRLNNLLCVPNITKNLLFVRQFTKDNNVIFEFHPSCCFVKDQATGHILLHGTIRDGLYVLQHLDTTSPRALIGEHTSADIWHARLRHPSNKVLATVRTNYHLPFSSFSSSFCDACQCNKSKRLPFSSSFSRCSRPLELLHSDLGGPAPITATGGYRY